MSFLQQLEAAWNLMSVGSTKSVVASGDWESCVESFKAKYGQCCDVDCRLSGSTTSSSVMTVFITKNKECVTPAPAPIPEPIPEPIPDPVPEEVDPAPEPSPSFLNKFRPNG